MPKIIKLSLIVFIFLVAIGLGLCLKQAQKENIGYFSPSYANAVGLVTEVPENPYNQAAKQLQNKEKKLETVASQLERSSQNRDFLLLLAIAFIIILFFLVILNYYLDYRRKKNENEKV